MEAFEVMSGHIRVTDPCYDPDTWCAGFFPAKNGIWIAEREVGPSSWGIRCHSLFIHHVDHPDARPNKDSGIYVGVDSGQAGFFDHDKYEDNQGGESFYDRICELTGDERQGGSIEWGTVSRSGYGDGSYRCMIAEEVDVVVAARIIFIDESEDDEEEDVYS